MKLSRSFDTSETCYVENIKSTNFILVQIQNPRIYELALFNQTTKIDTHKEKYFQSILEFSNCVASTLIYKHLSVGHADSNIFLGVIFSTWLRFCPVKCGFENFLDYRYFLLQLCKLFREVKVHTSPHRGVQYILIDYTHNHKNVRTLGPGCSKQWIKGSLGLVVVP